MVATRSPHGFPWLVTSLCGLVVAAVSGTTGVVAHGMASADSAMAVTSGSVLAAFLACGMVGVTTTRLARRLHPALAVVGGLLAAQGAVHLVLDWSHGAHAMGHSAHAGLGDAMHALYTPAEHSQMVREAMVAGAGGTGGAGAGHAQMTWSMLAAHAVATVAAAGLLAVIAGLLGWLSARAEELVMARVVIDDRRPVHIPETGARRVDSQYLMSRGGVRGPPLSV